MYIFHANASLVLQLPLLLHCIEASRSPVITPPEGDCITGGRGAYCLMVSVIVRKSNNVYLCISASPCIYTIDAECKTTACEQCNIVVEALVRKFAYNVRNI